MNFLTIPRGNNSQPSNIYFEADLSRLDQLTKGYTVVVITNDRLVGLYGDYLQRYRVITFAEGEAFKTLSTVETIHRQLLELGADRSVLLVGFGGGIVTDVTGFVASTFMRGVRFGFVATTLLAQVDASVGGKNGVNLDGYKNIIGTFNQPDWVICSLNVLRTLPERELKAGYAEAIKCGLLRDQSLLDMFDGGEVDLRRVVELSVVIKADIVSQDEREGGVRKLLNLGHTFAHGIEKCSHGRYLHGEAVAVGLVMAADASVQLGLLEQPVADRVRRVVGDAGLPVRCEDVERQALAEAMLSDKKKHGGVIEFILLEDVGRPVIMPVKVEDVHSLISSL